MTIQTWKEKEITIRAGETFVYNTVVPGVNVIQVVNRKAVGGGNVYLDHISNVSTNSHILKVEQGKTGNVARPPGYSLPTVYLKTDAASDLRVTIIEAVSNSLDVVFNASQVIDIQGTVSVAEPVTIDGTVAVSGEVEIKNDSGNPIPTTISAALPAGTNNIGDVDVATIPNITLAGKTAVKVTAAGAGDAAATKATAGVVYGIVALTTGLTVKLKDGTTERWAVSDTNNPALLAPISCGTSIILNFSGAGDAYIIYE